MLLVDKILTEMSKDVFGLILQLMTIVCSLTTAYLLSKKGYERYGYLLSFISLPLWIILEYHYAEWLYFILNPIYIYVFWKGLVNHWKDDKC